jgi:hypothetical protein
LISNAVSNTVPFTVQRPQITGLYTIPETSAASPSQHSPTLCWNPVASSWKYQVEISQEVTFTGADKKAALTEQSCYTIPTRLFDGAFYWRVFMLDGSNEPGLPSVPRRTWKRFPAPSPLFPTSLVNGTPTFRWAEVNGADRYHLQISDTPNFANVLYSADTVNTEHQPMKRLDLGYYYWRVKMIDRDNVEGPYSTFVFTVYLPAIRR